MHSHHLLAITMVAAALSSNALAHGGRRFDIQVIDNQLVAQGYVSTGVDDGGGIVRPYVNSLHGHWENNPSPNVTAAAADLPGFDVFDSSPLVGHDLTLTLLGGRQWLDPQIPSQRGDIVLDPLGATDIFVTYEGVSHSTSSPGSFLLAQPVGSNGALDIDLSYDIAARPSDVIYILDFVLSTNAPGVQTSDTVHILLSPDPLGPGGGLHAESLFLESYLGTPVPTPVPGMTLLVSGAAILRRPRR